LVSELFNYLNGALEYFNSRFADPITVLAGDFNNLSDVDICALGLINIVDQPTHEGHKLDRIYVSKPLYPTVKVISSGIKTKHLAIVARSDGGKIVDINKRSTQIIVRPIL